MSILRKHKKFLSTLRKGFQMTFENGLTASVQWGAGNYCENHFTGDTTYMTDAESNNAEVVVMDSVGRFLNANEFVPEEKQDWMDDVVGWMTPDQVVEFLYNVKNARV